MTTQELHIGLDLELQKLNSQVTQNIRPQEKDWFINKEVRKFIDKSMSGTLSPLQAGFQDVTRRIEDVKPLVRNKVRFLSDQGANAVIALPSDCYRLIACDITMAKDCDGAPSSTAKKEYRLEIPLSSITTTYNTIKISITIDGGQEDLIVTTDIPDGYLSSLDLKKQAFMLIKALKILLPKKLDDFFDNYDLYYEHDRDRYVPDTFILYTTDATYNSIVSFNNNPVTTPSTTSTVDSVDGSKYPLESNIRIIDDEFYSDAKHSHLSKSTSVSPMARIQNNQILVHKPEGVVLGSASVRYVCYPTLADVLLESNINMGRVALEKVLTNTVAYIKALISSNNYEAYKTENILTE